MRIRFDRFAATAAVSLLVVFTSPALAQHEHHGAEGKMGPAKPAVEGMSCCPMKAGAAEKPAAGAKKTGVAKKGEHAGMTCCAPRIAGKQAKSKPGTKSGSKAAKVKPKQ